MSEEELVWDGADGIERRPREKLPPMPERTTEMRECGQVWVWLRDHYEVRGTGVRAESENARKDWNQCDVEGCDRYMPCRRHPGSRPVGPVPPEEDAAYDFGFLSLPWEVQAAVDQRCPAIKLPFGTVDPYRCERGTPHGGDHRQVWTDADGVRRRARWNDDGQLHVEEAS